MDLRIGLELEFIVDRQTLIEKLKLNNIPYIETQRHWRKVENCLVIKDEFTLHDPLGLELNFPPSYSLEDLEKVLNVLNTLPVKFNRRCAMHIHISFLKMTEEQIDKIFNYYIINQDSILNEAMNNELYVNLNRYLTVQNRSQRHNNLNTVAAFKKHKTIEHRIYKSTIDLDKIKWAINQTKTIVEEALNS